MIYTSVNVKINSNGTATSSNKVVLYRGDREVEIQMTLTGNPYIVKESTFAQLIIRRENATPIITGIAPLKDSKVILTITEENIDELTEVGSYAYQIRLYDDDMSARITLPPVENGLEVREPIVDEASGAIGRAMVNYSLISRAAIDENSTFNEYDEYNRTIWRDGDYITDAKMNKIEDALYVINQRVLSNAESAYISTEMQEDQKVGVGESLDISFEFISPNKGKGTLKVSVNGIQKISQYVEQEELITINLPEEYFSKGDNKVTLYVIDRAGKASNELVFMVRYGSTELTPDFDQYAAYQYGASVRYYFIPSCLDTSSKLLFYMEIDGTPKEPMECTSDVRGYYTFPNNLSVGAHHCKAYLIDGQGNRSNEVVFNLIIIDAYSIVIASDTKNPVIEEGSQLVLDYKIYMENADTFIAKVYVDDVLVSSGECGLETAYYRNSSLTEGTHIIRIEAWNKEETISDYVVWNVTVTESVFEKIVPATAGGIFLASATDHSNSDQNRDKWVGVDQDGNEVVAQLEDFTFDSESGWVDNELVFGGVAKAVIPVKPLANNARYGFTLDLEFTSTEIGAEGALVLDLWDYTKDCGIKITTEKLRLRSAEGNEASLYFEDSANTSVIFVIDRNEKKAKIYLNGVMCSAFNLSDYESNGKWVLEDFTVDDYIRLGGKGSSKIRNLRVYQVALTTNEIINNFISNKQSKDEQKELVEFQKGLHLPTLTIYCDFSGLGKDDKKPCKIVYSSTDEEKYGKSFELDHKESSVQYQGTSSMAYPIKNYRINLRDENGDKLYYDFPFGKPECRFTLKADFMSSGHWQNTGLTKWINDNLYNYNEKDEKSMNPKKWFDLQNGGSIDDTRECIYGFPCRLILVNDGNTPLNAGQNEPTPGNTKDMGIFNFNHDKDATDTMGFDKDNFPNCMGFEVTANSDTSAGAFMKYKGKLGDFSSEEGFCTINLGFIGGGYYTSLFPIELFDGLDSINLKAWTVNVVGVDANYNEIITKKGRTNMPLDEIIIEGVKYIRLIVSDPTDQLGINNVVMNYEKVVSNFKPNDIVTEIYQAYSEADELEYYKQSFELRFPDEDDVEPWYGFLGINAGTMVTDFYKQGDDYSTSYWEWDIFNTALHISSDKTIKSIECYYYDELLINMAVNATEKDVTLVDGTNTIRFIFDDKPEYFYINDTKYILGKEISELSLINPYLGEEISPEYGIKRLVEWVDTCSDEEFVRDFEQYFHKDYTLRYYLLVITLGMVDNLGKNMMLDSWDGKIFMPRFYDCDTICSYDNTGDIVFDVDIEMTQGYWNTSSSRLWTRIRDLMHPELVEKYNNMRQNGLSYESLMRCFYDEQIAKIPQKYYNMDYDVKYAPFGDSYMGMAHGDGYEHLKRWLKKRILFVDSLFDYEPSYTSDMLTIRANTTEPMSLTIETYDPQYVHVSWYNGQMDKIKVDGKTPVTFTGRAMAATDQEVLIYGGTNIKKLSGISTMNPGELIIGAATRLAELDASNCPILTQINLNKANLSAHPQLIKLNLSNCPELGGNLRIDNSKLLQELNIENTAISGINFPPRMRNLLKLKVGGTNITSLDLSIWDTSNVTDMRNMFYGCSNLTNLEGLENWDTSKVTSMTNMFAGCNNLTSLDVSSFDTSNVTNMAYMFNGCSKLTSIEGIGEWDTSEVVDMTNMFAGCNNLTSLDVSGWDASKVTSMSNMFNNCSGLTSLDLSGWDTYEVTTMANMFQHCKKLTNIEGIGEWDTSKVKDMQGMFNDCKALTSLDLSGWDTSSVLSMHYMFYESSKLTSLDLSGWDTSSVTNTYFMFNNCFNLIKINAENCSEATLLSIIPKLPTRTADKRGYITARNITDEITAQANAIYWFFKLGYTIAKFTTTDATKLPGFNSDYVYAVSEIIDNGDETSTVEITSWDDFSSVSFKGNAALVGVEKLKVTSKVTNMDNMFRFCYNLTSLNATDWDTSNVTSMYYMFSNCQKLISLEGITTWDTSKVNNIDGMFDSCKKLTSIEGIGEWDTSKVTSMMFAFFACNNLTSLDLSGWTTSKVTSMQSMFSNCNNLTSLDSSSFVTSSVTNMSSMFTGCNSLTSIEGIGEWDTSKVTSMSEMFRFCNNLTSLEGIENWDTSEVTSMAAMFHNCNSLTSIEGIGEWDTSKVNNMDNMFFNCWDLTSIEGIGEWDTSNLTTMGAMFYGCSSLTSLDVTGWGTSKVYNMASMFHSCKSLTSINGIENWKTSSLNFASNMFHSCNSLTSIDVSGFDTSKVENMDYMFNACNSLTSLNVEMWPLNDITQAAINSLPVGDDAKNDIYASSNFTVPTGWTLIYSNPYDIAIYTCNESGVLPTFNAEYTGYSVEEIDKGDGTYKTYIRTNDLDDMPTRYSFKNKLSLLSVEKLKVTSNVTTMENMFYNCNNLTNIEGIGDWDTSKVTSMYYMFSYCNNLTSLEGIENWNTSNVTAMNGMFSTCSKLTNLDLSGWDTSKVTSMGSMFDGCNKLTSLDLSGFDTSEVTIMANMFSGCSKLTSIDVSGWDTSKVTSMASMFYVCSGLTSIEGTGEWDTSEVTNIGSMFNKCRNLTSIEGIKTWDTSKVTYMANMFASCNKLTSLDLSGWDTSKVTNMTYMFDSCKALTSLNVEMWPLNDITQTAISSLPVGDDAKNEIQASSNFAVPTGWTLIYSNPYDIAIYTCSESGVLPTFNTEYTGYSVEEINNGDGTYKTCIRTNDLDIMPTRYNFSNKSSLLSVEKLKVTSKVTAMNSMFTNCNKLTSLDATDWDTSKVTNMSFMFASCHNLTSIEGIETWKTPEVTSMDNMFYSCKKLTSIEGIGELDTSKVTLMSNMFYNCSGLTSLDLSGWNISKVANMSNMFNGCKKLTSIEGIGEWVTSKVTTMTSMFNNCNSLTSLDLSGWDTSEVTSMSEMFSYCNGLTSLDLSDWNISKVANMSSMFYNCDKLTSIEGIGEWVTSKVTSMAHMFNGCYKLTSLDLSGFDTSKVTSMSYTFYGCDKLTNLDSMTNISVSLSLSTTVLDASSLLDVIDNLATVTTTKTLTLGSTLLARLTAEQIAVATNKGWNVV